MSFIKKYAQHIMLFALICLPALKFAFVLIFNEDYLVLSWHNPQNFCDSFADFYSSVTGGPYWRPIVWSSYFATKFFFAYQGLPYHITNLAVYGLVNILIYNLLEKLGIDKKTNFAIIIAFALMPSRELIFAWIPGRTDLLMSFFLLLSLNFYLSAKAKWQYAFAAVFYLFAVLSKETAYAGAMLPILLIFIDKRNIYDKFKAAAVAVAIIFAALLYRYFVIGGMPFASSNFVDLQLVNLLKNYVAYIFLSFVNADMLELTYNYLSHNYILAASLSAMILLLIYLLTSRKKSEINWKMLLFGASWFSLFILPATPLLMQWYGYIASIGVLIIVAELLKPIGKVKYLLLGLVYLLSAAYTYSRSEQWIETSNITNGALLSLKEANPQSDTLYLLAMPDKINRINAMKIGSQQAVQHILSNDKIEVIFPLRAEILSGSIISSQFKQGELILKMEQGRFLTIRAKSSNIYKDETIDCYEDGIHLKINNFRNGQAIASITMDSSHISNAFFFDGEKFRKISVQHK